MSEERREQLMREAADIFFLLRDDPDNADLHAKRDAFISRGKEERDTYDQLLKTWKASGVMRAPKTLRTLVLLICGLGGATALAYEPVRIAMLADLSTTGAPEQSTLASGDIAVLDADTALVDNTNAERRSVILLEGAAYFAVETNERPFTVDFGEIQVTVVGTEFETAFVGETLHVSVAEGQVNVIYEDQIWELSASDHLTWTTEMGAVITQRDATAIATWRSDRLVVDGLTFGQASDIIQRRLSGPVVFMNPALRDMPVAGSIDLAEPLLALRILADLADSRVYDLPGIGRIIASR